MPKKLDVDSHLSNIKDINYAEWDRLDPQATLHAIASEIRREFSASEFIGKVYRLSASFHWEILDPGGCTACELV